MKFLSKYILSIFLSISFSTFSIVAVDLENGLVGSAGASCIAGSIIISDIHPGVGAIHTQSYWSGYNQIMASDMMDLGLSPEQIIDYIVENDVSNNPTIRQYGIVDLYDGGRSAAFTGSNCMDYKGHIFDSHCKFCLDAIIDPFIKLNPNPFPRMSSSSHLGIQC